MNAQERGKPLEEAQRTILCHKACNAWESSKEEFEGEPDAKVVI